MNGIVININPVLLHFGGFELRWYSVAVMLGALVGVWVAAREAKKRGIAPDEIYSIAVWAVIGGLLGARLFHVIDRFDYYLSNPSQMLGFQGLAIWGGLAGGSAAVILYVKARHLSLGRLADTAAPGLLVGQIVGRLGCIVNGDAYGGVTTFPWGFIYVHPDALIPGNLFNLATHPYPVYEMLWNSAVLVLLLTLSRRLKTDGALFWSYLSL